MCPVSRVEMNGRHPFCVIWKTGVVLAKRCLKEIPHAELFEVAECSFEDDDVISLNPDEKEYEEMKLKWKEWYTKRKEKKKKKRKRIDDDKTKKSKKKKKKKKRKDGDSGNSTTAMRSASRLSTEAESRIETEKKTSSVYASLFNKNSTHAVGAEEKANLFIG